MITLKNIFRSNGFLLAVYTLLALVVSLQQYHLGGKSDTATHYNNFIIFRQSFLHLVHNNDLYALYPAEYYDYYKYSPAFALFMGAFAYLPVPVGLILWNVLNAMVLFFAFKSLPVPDQKIKIAVMWFVVIELITSLQNSQSNALIAGLLILAFNFLERRRIAYGTMMIALTVFIKIFGLVAFSLFFLYADKKRFFGWSALWITLLTILPLLVVTPHQLIFLYQSWVHLLQMDFDGSIGISVAGWLQTWFHFDPPKHWITLAGIILFCIPLLYYQRYSQFIFRWLILCSILIWIIIFNHKAESATFIIAVSGIALWYFSQERNYFNLTLLILAFLFTCLSPTDLFPSSVRKTFFIPYVVKVFPCIIIWMKITRELITGSYHPKTVIE